MTTYYFVVYRGPTPEDDEPWRHLIPSWVEQVLSTKSLCEGACMLSDNLLAFKLKEHLDKTFPRYEFKHVIVDTKEL